ncbi:YkgJ family cysteine cluster protein [Euhalothece natronophila Z-M001]|uniref:YkgJ family cysteine cluster protein n=1 Tax=Euhalothece natronophila Z-M001 TaxID=522448 RepID=A0A5B8NPA8_9CHRO|nr:YkgJ family cysteine cluster protein [Euhalothece natronophila]QDZ40894.1 YkgJ family cysteine cluster protein [Euhalothece natronophila Z-M001]
MPNWSCMKNCGACCYLEPSERPELEDYLSWEELKQYHDLVGEDGWCVHYQKETKTCGIYEQRPSFCRVSAENFKRMFGVNREEFDEFAIDCCCEHIASLYGEDSEEMTRYLELVDHE